MRKAVVLCVLAGMLSLLALSVSAETTINAIFMKQAGYSEDEVREMTKTFMQQNPDIKVELTFVAYEALEQKILIAGTSGGLDVALGDAPWTAKFATAKIVMDISDKVKTLDVNDIFAGALDSIEYQGKLYGLPWLNDTKYLFYNIDMLEKVGIKEPPKTYSELWDQAKLIKEKGLVEYPMAWSWSMAECLMCDFTSLTYGFGGGMIAKDGTPQLTHEGNLKALKFMQDSIKEGLSNPASTEFIEDDVLGMFQSGKIAFAFNWAYMYSAVAGKLNVGMTIQPGTGDVRSAAVNGGMGLHILAGSTHPEEAWKYIAYLTSKDVQMQYTKNALPIWKSAYSDEKMLAQNPLFVKVSGEQFQYMVSRPKVAWYPEFSTAMQAIVQNVLLGQLSPEDALAQGQAKAIELSQKQ